MRNRCSNPNVESFKNYGARGIRVCDQWNDSFATFLADVGLRPSSNHSLGRIDNEGNYEPGNVEWQTPEQQQNNTRANRLLSHRGDMRTMAQWARLLGTTTDAIAKRLDLHGWTIERALDTPFRKNGPKRFTELVLAAGYESVAAFGKLRQFSPGTLVRARQGRPLKANTVARICASLGVSSLD